MPNIGAPSAPSAPVRLRCVSTYTFWIHLPVTSDPERHADIAHNLWDGLKGQHDDKVSHLVMAWDTRRDDILKVAMSAKWVTP
jgi:hypothetical protein